MGPFRRAAAFALLIASATLCGAQAKPPRVALVIGNGAYKHAAALGNPVNDAADVARELEGAGFTVIRRDNASLREMHLALREFGDKLTKTTTGVFYFAGHGVQVRGRNYLLPVDADIAREDEVAFSAMDLGAVMEKLDSARNPVNIVILDACRDNPFGGRIQMSAKGLAQVEAPPGTLIAFATAPGSVAADGNGRNGLYTTHLLAAMRVPGQPIEDTLKTVRAAVRKGSANLQVPWESTSLESHFSFRQAAAKAAAPRQAPVSSHAARNLPPSAPPALAAGDRWTYRVRNLLDGTESQRSMRVAKIRGGDVEWSDGAVSDIMGNFTRMRLSGKWQTFAPSSHTYVFPLRPGATYDVAFTQEGGDRIYDGKVRITVSGEEEIVTPAGKFRAVKFERQVDWKRRDRESDAGVTLVTYWYNAGAKRWVAQEQTKTTLSGKVTLRERWELESYELK